MITFPGTTFLWVVWVIAAGLAMVFIPKELVLTERSVPLARRLAVALLSVAYVFTIATLAVVLLVFVAGVVAGLGRV